MALTQTFYDRLDEIINDVGVQHISYDDKVVRIVKLDGTKVLLPVEDVFDYTLI